MENPVILIANYWLNVWCQGHRAPASVNVCVALAYGGDAGRRLDLRPRRGGRQKLESILLPQILSEPFDAGSPIVLRRPGVRMGVQSSGMCDSIRVECVTFELGANMEVELDKPRWAELAQRLRARSDLALRPWLGEPMAIRAEWCDHRSGGFFATDGDPGIVRAYLNPRGALSESEGVEAWQSMAREVAAWDLDKSVPEPGSGQGGLRKGRPRV